MAKSRPQIGLNLTNPGIRKAMGLITAQELMQAMSYKSISVLDRLLNNGLAPQPDYFIKHQRYWKREKLKDFPKVVSRKLGKHGEYDPAIQMDSKLLQLLRDTQRFYRVLAEYSFHKNC